MIIYFYNIAIYNLIELNLTLMSHAREKCWKFHFRPTVLCFTLRCNVFTLGPIIILIVM